MPRDADGDHRHGAVARNVELGQRPGKIGAPIGDRGGACGVRSCVVHHDAADVLEVAVATVAPAWILDGVDALGLKYVEQPDRISRPRSCLSH
jgi:hypothetical protein